MTSSQTVELTADQQSQVFEPVKKAYSDFLLFPLISESLKQAIVDCECRVINRFTSKQIADSYLSREDFDTPELPGAWRKIQLIFKSAYVLILFHRELDNQRFEPKSNPILEVIWVTKSMFLSNYPEFKSVEVNEQDLLFNFRNMVKVAILFINPKMGKQNILDIAGRLEGSQCAYITGGGQRVEVTRRVAIYERESGINPDVRHERSLSTAAKKKVTVKVGVGLRASGVKVKRKATTPYSKVVAKRVANDRPLVTRAVEHAGKEPLSSFSLPSGLHTPSQPPHPGGVSGPAVTEVGQFPADWGSAAAYVAQWAETPSTEGHCKLE